MFFYKTQLVQYNNQRGAITCIFFFDRTLNMDRHIYHVCQTSYVLPNLRNHAWIKLLLTRAAAQSHPFNSYMYFYRLDFFSRLLADLPFASPNILQVLGVLKKYTFDREELKEVLKGKFSSGREGALASKFNYDLNKNNYQKWCFAFIFESFLCLFE